MKRTLYTIGLFLLAGALLFTSCDAFFSATWGEAREYKMENIKLTATNVDEWVENAVGNPALAKALTEKIIDELKNVKKGDPSLDQLKLQQAGVTLAVESSGIGQTIVSNIDTITKMMDPDSGGGDINKLLTDTQKDFKASGGEAAAGNLSTVVSGSIVSGTTPEFCSLYSNSASASDVTQAVMVLALAEFDEGELNDLTLNNQTEVHGLRLSADGKKVEVANSATEQQIALAAYLNLINGNPNYKDDPLLGKFQSGFGL